MKIKAQTLTLRTKGLYYFICILIARFRVAKNASFIVDKNECAKLQMTEDEIFSIAKENTYADYCFLPLNDVLAGLMLENGVPEENISDLYLDEKDELPLFVASNSDFINGAAVITSEKVREELYHQLGDKNYYILPSSVHEVLVLPKGTVDDIDFLRQMVAEVNRTEVHDKDKLSNEVYFYNGKTHEFGIARSAFERKCEQKPVVKAAGKGR